LSAKTGTVIETAQDAISDLMANKGRIKYELGVGKKEEGISRSADEFLGELGIIQDEYPGFLRYAQVAQTEVEDFVLIFCASEMKKYDIKFDMLPLITDVTYSAVPEGYFLCSSVIYVPVVRKHLVIFQSLIVNQEAQQFKQHFLKLFQYYNVTIDKFLGSAMDFSKAQRLGYNQAFQEYFNADGMMYLKACYMH
jgi:hypothetical protein